MLHFLHSRYSFIPGLLSIILSILLSIWTPFDLLMNERLEMRRGLPPFEWWTVPPEPILKVYIFNVTNSKNFLEGLDSKIIIQEVGPVVFRESWLHSNVVFNQNSTMTYNLRRNGIYDEHLNNLDLDSIVTVPNMALLGSASYIWNTPFFVKYAFNGLVSMLDTKPFVNLTIRNYLYNYTDPLLKVVHRYAPGLAPTDNMGIISTLYEPYGENVTAFIGPSSGHSKFSLIDNYNGEKSIPGYGDLCKDEITNASEAVMYNQFIEKTQELKYYRKLLCRVVPLHYKDTFRRYGLNGYKFLVPPEIFNRTTPFEDDCYKNDPPLLDGLSDLSNCLYSFPLAGSFPHFLFGDVELQNQVVGLKPNASIHHSYVLVEPTTGIPLEEKAMIQINIQMRPLRGFNSVLADKFSDSIVPLFWLEFSMMNLPYYVLVLIYSILILRYLQWIVVALLFISGLRLVRKCCSKEEAIVEKQVENETFLMKNIERNIVR